MHDQGHWRYHPCRTMLRCPLRLVPKDMDTTERLIAHLIEEKERAPMRYGM